MDEGPSALEEPGRRSRPTISIVLLVKLVLVLVGLCLLVVLGWVGFWWMKGVRISTPAQYRTCEQNVQGIVVGMEAYRREHGANPLSQNELVPEFLSAFPRCPVVGRTTYRMSLFPDGTYLIECTGRSHTMVSGGVNQPSHRSQPIVSGGTASGD